VAEAAASSHPAARAPAAAAGDPEEEEAPRAMVALMGAGWEAAVAAQSVETAAAKTVVAG
jgi:hypothetical protein